MHSRPLIFVALVLSFGITLALSQQETATPADMYLGKGYEALKLDRYEEAIRDFRAALALDSNLVERAQFPLAVALFELHRPEESRHELEAIRVKLGDHPNVLYYLGRIEVESRNFDAAVKDLTTAATQPPFPDTYYYLGFACLKQNDFAGAEKWLRQAQEVLPRDARIPYQLGLLYQKLGRGEEAAKEIARSEQIRQQDDHESQLKNDCAHKLDQGLKEEAHAVCDQLYDANNAEHLMSLGTLYARHGDPEAALKPLHRAAELSPQSPQMQYNLALAYFQLNQFENARGPLVTALQRWPDLFQLNFLYGAVLLNLREDIAAYPILHHAHELNPDDPPTGEMLFTAAISTGKKRQAEKQFPLAIELYEEAGRLHPWDPEPHRLLAETYGSMHDPQRATAEQQRAEELTAHPN
jgi:tetratricopeptide (TPR) repeat protein